MTGSIISRPDIKDQDGNGTVFFYFEIKNRFCLYESLFCLFLRLLRSLENILLQKE